MAKWKGNDETNMMVCSPSASEERWRRKGSPELERSRRCYSLELGKMTEPTSESSNPPDHGVDLDEINFTGVSVCTGSARFRTFAGKARRKVRRNLVDAKVRRGFLGARVIETG
jgi:hypothetical protein